MSKKVVVTLSILAIVFAAAAVGLFFVVKGKTELAVEKLKPIDEFADKGKLTEHPFEARLVSPGKAASAITALRADVASKIEDIAARDAKISGLEKNVRDRDANIAELETAKSELTRNVAEVKDKADKAQAELTVTTSKVKGLEESIAAQAEATAKKIDELTHQMDGEKAVLLGDFEKFRAAYAKNYNYAVGKGITPPVGPDPLGVKGVKSDGPRFGPISYLAEVVAVDARQGFLVLSIGPESGIAKDQAFDAYLGTQNLGRVNIISVLNGSVTTAAIAPGGQLEKFTNGITLRLLPLGIATAPATAAAPAAAAPAVAPAPAAQ